MNEQNEMPYLTENDPNEKKPRKPFKVRLIRAIKITGVVLVSLVLVVSIAFVSMYFIGRNRVHSNTGITDTVSDLDIAIEDDGRTVIHNGVKYALNENIVSILCMGTDVEEFSDSDGTIGENGQADAIYLLTIDISTGETNVISISRDTMTDVDVYSYGDSFMGTKYMQVCLSYAYGDGKASSCENVVKSVSRLLYGMPINNYYALDFNALPVINDAVGGITLTALDTIDMHTRRVYAGETVTLWGDEATRYVRHRNPDILDSNNSRMQRQRQYLTALAQRIFDLTRSNITAPVNILNKSANHTVTDLDATKLVYLATTILSHNVSGTLNFKNIEGEVVMGEKYAEFYPDRDKLYELILDVFYNPVETVVSSSVSSVE